MVLLGAGSSCFEITPSQRGGTRVLARTLDSRAVFRSSHHREFVRDHQLTSPSFPATDSASDSFHELLSGFEPLGPVFAADSVDPCHSLLARTLHVVETHPENPTSESVDGRGGRVSRAVAHRMDVAF